jgi:ribonuclease HI
MAQQPHYLLICDAVISSPTNINNESMPSVGLGRWHFILERMDGPERLEASDGESYIHIDRLALLAVVRGLEALEQSSMVRLVTTSRYVDRGLRFGLPNWRETNYQWESFGERKPVRNADLWRRVDVAMQYHKVACRLLKSNVASAEAEGLVNQETEVQTAMIAPPCSASQEPLMTDPQVTCAAVANPNTELVGRFSPARVAYRVDAPHRMVAGPSRSRLQKAVQQDSSLQTSQSCGSLRDPTLVRGANHDNRSGRLQWWEMASKWDNSASLHETARQSNYGT